MSDNSVEWLLGTDFWGDTELVTQLCIFLKEQGKLEAFKEFANIILKVREFEDKSENAHHLLGRAAERAFKSGLNDAFALFFYIRAQQGPKESC